MPPSIMIWFYEEHNAGVNMMAQNIPKIMHTIHILLYFVVVWYKLILPLSRVT